jgi:hypothetical protein
MNEPIYKVKSGDTFASVAKNLYGNTNAACALASVNGVQANDPDELIQLNTLKSPNHLWGTANEPSSGIVELDFFKLKSEIIEVGWEKTSIIAWDSSDKLDMKTKIRIVNLNVPKCATAILEVFQYSLDGNHVLYKKYDSLVLDGEELFFSDGKQFEVFIEWHNSIYDYGKTQYFCKLTAGSHEKISYHTANALLQLKHYDSLVANPSGDLPGASREGNWVHSYFTQFAPWLEATANDLVANGHKVKSYSVTETISMKILVERNKFIHHQSSHGTAYCMCNGTKNYVQDSGIAAADGNNDYRCPVCNTYNNATGCIFLKDWSNLFFAKDVKNLTRSPKILILANCCLTAITNRYPNEWLAKGTRWYIGWALPVGDADAVSFAKAFYRRWMVRYKMDPGKVRNAFNDVKGPYSQYRPRIFGN